MTDIFTHRAAVLVGALVIGAVLSGRAEAVSAPGDCEVTGCGSNTPVLYGTPIIGLDLEGSANALGVVLDPNLYRVQERGTEQGECPLGAVLGVQHGMLVGEVDGVVRCSGQAMIGMAFKLTVPCNAMRYGKKCPSTKVPVEIRISEQSRVWTWLALRPTQVPSYRLTWDNASSPGAAASNDSLCPRREAWMEREQLWNLGNRKLPSVHRRRYEQWKRRTDHLLVVQGEAYKDDASVDLARLGARWFNVACVGTALAKMRLMGYDPIATSGIARTSAEARQQDLARRERQATLKMITARYRGAKSYTFAGVPLKWRHVGGVQYLGDPDPASWSAATMESLWTASGALCLSHRRTWQKLESLNGASPWPEKSTPPRKGMSAQLYKYLEESVTESIRVKLWVPKCTSTYSSSEVFWETYPVDHVAHQ